MGAREHVHGVDLHEPDPLDHAPEVPPVDPPGGSAVAEPLGLEGDPLGLAAAEDVGRQSHDLGRVGSAGRNTDRHSP